MWKWLDDNNIPKLIENVIGKEISLKDLTIGVGYNDD